MHSPAPTPEPDERLDLRGVRCPHNTGRALLALELMDEGEVLEILIDDGEPLENVPVSMDMEGHRVLSMERDGAAWRLRIERGEDV